MKPGDLRFWNEADPALVGGVFVLLERVRLDSAGGTKEDGWRILEGDVVKGVYEIIIESYSRSSEEVAK